MVTYHDLKRFSSKDEIIFPIEYLIKVFIDLKFKYFKSKYIKNYILKFLIM